MGVTPRLRRVRARLVTILAASPSRHKRVTFTYQPSPRAAVEERAANLYFDKKTYLLTKSECRTTDKDGTEATDERIVTEYAKDKNGVPVPKRVRLKRDGGEVMELDVTEFTYLEKLDDNEFKK